MKKAVIMDIDGTLTNSSKKITPETRRALLQAQNEGALLVLASGRPVSGIMDYAVELEMDRHHGLIVAFNGSKVIDCQTGEVLFNETLTVEEGRAVLEHMKKFDVHPMIDRGDYLYVNDAWPAQRRWDHPEMNIVEFEVHAGHFKVCEIEDLAAFADFPLNKILNAGEPEYLQAHYQEMEAPFRGKLNAMFTAPVFFEFTSLGVDKAKALDAVLRPMGFEPEDMIAFGDSDNDRSMVEYAGTGVAMDNAVPDLKEAADVITGSNDEDGIVPALNAFLSR